MLFSIDELLVAYVRLCSLQPANNVFLSHQTSNNQQLPTSQQYFSLTTNQISTSHQPQPAEEASIEKRAGEKPTLAFQDFNHVLVLGATGILTALCEVHSFQKKKTSCQPEKNMLPPRNPVKWPRATRAHPRLPGSPGYKLPWPPSPSSVLAVTSPANHEPVEWQAGRQASSVVSARVVAAFELHAEGRRPRAPRLDG